jgi:hypothetical protein
VHRDGKPLAQLAGPDTPEPERAKAVEEWKKSTAPRALKGARSVRIAAALPLVVDRPLDERPSVGRLTARGGYLQRSC